MPARAVQLPSGVLMGPSTISSVQLPSDDLNQGSQSLEALELDHHLIDQFATHTKFLEQRSVYPE